MKMKNRILIAALGVFAFSLAVGLIFFGRLSGAVKSLEVSVDHVGAGKRSGVTLLKRNDTADSVKVTNVSTPS